MGLSSTNKTLMENQQRTKELREKIVSLEEDNKKKCKLLYMLDICIDYRKKENEKLQKQLNQIKAAVVIIDI